MREQIKKFCILSVKMEGFKRFKEAYEVTLDRIAYISGSNGEGKTTIADAISYAFCGSPFWGEHSSDRLQNTESKEMCVEVKFVDENGEVHTLTRRRQKDLTAITFDTLQLRQQDVTELFAEKDIFLSIFNPLYFIEKVATKGREFLQKLLPPISSEDVLALLDESTRELLENESLLDPAYYIKKKREELKEIENDRNYFDGQADLLKTQQRESEAKVDEVIKKGEEIVSKKEALEKKQFEGIDVETLKARQAQISASLSDGKREKLFAKQTEAQNRQYVSKLTGEIAKVQAEITAMKEKREKVISQAKSIKVGDKCPTCFTVVTEENLSRIVGELKKQYEELTLKGQGVVSAYKDLLALDEKSKAKFEEFRQEDLKRIEAELAAYNTGDVTDIAMLEDKIRLGNLTEEEYSELVMVRKQAEEFGKEVELLTKADEIPAKLKAIEKGLENAKTREAALQKLINAANLFAAKRAELTLKPLKMNRAAISLFSLVKTTGELKDDFKFTYDGKDYRWLSASEKIKAGLEVANLLARLTGLAYPTFIDNAECITTKLDGVCGQVLLAYARSNGLTVQCPQRTPIQMKEAA